MTDKTLRILTLIIIAAAMAYAHHHIAIAKNYVYVPPAWYVAEPKVISGLKFHGIQFAESDQYGNLTFMRDGHKCRLFNVHFERSWKTKESGELR